MNRNDKQTDNEFFDAKNKINVLCSINMFV